MFPRRARIKRVLSSWDSSFLYFLVWRIPETGDRFEIRGTAEEFFYRGFRNLFAVSDTILLHIRLNIRRVRHSSAARFVSALLDSTYENKLYQSPKFAGAVRNL